MVLVNYCQVNTKNYDFKRRTYYDQSCREYHTLEATKLEFIIFILKPHSGFLIFTKLMIDIEMLIVTLNQIAFISTPIHSHNVEFSLVNMCLNDVI